MSGAWPPPAPSVVGVNGAAFKGSDGVLHKTRFVESIRVDGHLDITPSATVRQVSMDAGVSAPQSSCNLSPMAPAAICSCRALGKLALPLPKRPKFIGRLPGFAACAPYARGRGAGGGVGAGGRPGAAADHRSNSAHQRLFNLLWADKVDVGVYGASGEYLPFACNDLGAGAYVDGDVRLNIRVARLAYAADAAVLIATSALTMPQWSRIRALVMTVSGVSAQLALALAHAIANHLAAAEFYFFAVDGEVLLLQSTDRYRPNAPRSPTVGPNISA